MAVPGGQGSGVALQDALQNVDVLDELPLPDEQVGSGCLLCKLCKFAASHLTQSYILSNGAN